MVNQLYPFVEVRNRAGEELGQVPVVTEDVRKGLGVHPSIVPIHHPGPGDISVALFEGTRRERARVKRRMSRLGVGIKRKLQPDELTSMQNPEL
jgi:hypothetical protein